jgi:hypothetical protein
MLRQTAFSRDFCWKTIVHTLSIDQTPTPSWRPSNDCEAMAHYGSGSFPML